MRSSVAIVELGKLKDEATDPTVTASGEGFTSWRARVASILTTALGRRHHLVESFDSIHYGLSMWTENTPQSAWDRARRNGISRACGLIDAAIYELNVLQGDDEPIDERAFDLELWEHVRGLVEANDWAKVGSQVAIFVEDRVRSWTGHPKDRNGEDLVGKGLFSTIFSDDSEFRLGRKRAEWEGWRMLGMGFAQALSNVDRHRIQNRVDARRYALGVLGVGSLLLTQLRYEHEDHLNHE